MIVGIIHSAFEKYHALLRLCLEFAATAPAPLPIASPALRGQSIIGTTKMPPITTAISSAKLSLPCRSMNSDAWSP